MKLSPLLLSFLALPLVSACVRAQTLAGKGIISQDAILHTVTMADADRKLRIRLNYGGRCLLDSVQVDGRETVAPETGVADGILVNGQWVTTRSGIAAPQVRVTGDVVDVVGIAYATGGVSVRESWRFTVQADHIDWRISRSYPSGAQVEDTMLPGWDFATMDTWTGGILDTGGVAWGHLLGSYASYGAHANGVTFWKPGQRGALRVTTMPAPGIHVATRFTRQPSGIFSYVQSAATAEITTKHGLRRFLGSGADLWSPISIQSAATSVDMRLQAVDYAAEYGQRKLPGIDGSAITELMNTIGRYGVTDRNIVTGNGWVTGFVCLHEPFYGALAAAVDDPHYTASLAGSLDDWRDHAVKPDGRVMARWVYEAGMDNMVPGTYDPATGYYDCGWGYLLDAQPDYPINVSETFNLTGDKQWLRGHKESCERALDWMLARDFDGSGLMTMMTDSHTQGKSSDWIDIVLACGKNALVNAEMYGALNLWADREEILGDKQHAARYRAAARKLKTAFVRPISQGGFWDPDKGWFAYWIEKDGSVHGDNLVTPVNFSAIAYGLCSDTQRKSILDNIETRMGQEKLFHWPLCFTSYKPEECLGMMPFPAYENGDIFLSWGELGVRAYAAYNPTIALKYVRAILDKHKKDGLAFQRYLRNSQDGAGDDILAGNSNTVAGLFRDIYGIRPQWNRLLLDPHMTPELSGTRLLYQLRNQRYEIGLYTDWASVAVNGFTVRSAGAFAVNSSGKRLTCYQGASDRAAFDFTRSADEPLAIDIVSWPGARGGACRWTETGAAASLPIHRTISGLKPKSAYSLVVDENAVSTLVTDADGTVQFDRDGDKYKTTFGLVPKSQ